MKCLQATFPEGTEGLEADWNCCPESWVVDAAAYSATASFVDSQTKIKHSFVLQARPPPRTPLSHAVGLHLGPGSPVCPVQDSPPVFVGNNSHIESYVKACQKSYCKLEQVSCQPAFSARVTPRCGLRLGGRGVCRTPRGRCQ